MSQEKYVSNRTISAAEEGASSVLQQEKESIFTRLPITA